MVEILASTEPPDSWKGPHFLAQVPHPTSTAYKHLQFWGRPESQVEKDNRCREGLGVRPPPHGPSLRRAQGMARSREDIGWLSPKRVEGYRLGGSVLPPLAQAALLSLLLGVLWKGHRWGWTWHRWQAGVRDRSGQLRGAPGSELELPKVLRGHGGRWGPCTEEPWAQRIKASFQTKGVLVHQTPQWLVGRARQGGVPPSISLPLAPLAGADLRVRPAGHSVARSPGPWQPLPLVQPKVWRCPKLLVLPDLPGRKSGPLHWMLWGTQCPLRTHLHLLPQNQSVGES